MNLWKSLVQSVIEANRKMCQKKIDVYMHKLCDLKALEQGCQTYPIPWLYLDAVMMATGVTETISHFSTADRYARWGSIYQISAAAQPLLAPPLNSSPFLDGTGRATQAYKANFSQGLHV